MPHRGRLNLLTDLLEYSPTSLFHKIKGGAEIPEDLGAEGDVLSHLGMHFSYLALQLLILEYIVASPILNYDGASNPIQVSLLPNPSHLGKSMNQQSLSFVHLIHSEAVNPVAMGKTRAKQYSLLKTSPEDCDLGDKVMCVQLHGDASFAGQGVVMESLGLSAFRARI
jgi:probable 2-oxoglutarate dehydrogenase E1 component DHKTD1